MTGDSRPDVEPDATTDTAVAAAFAVRLCLGRVRPDDDELAVRLIRKLVERPGGLADDGGTVVGAVWVGMPGLLGEPDEQAWAAVVHCTRSLGAMRDAPVEQVTLAAAALGLLAGAGRSPHAGADLVRAANWARRVEQHDLAAWCARKALDREAELTPRERTSAVLVLAVVVGDPDVVGRLYRSVGELEHDDEIRVVAELLRPVLRPDEGSPLSTAGDAVMANDRRTAAEVLRQGIDAQRARLVDDDLMRGLSDAYAALAAPALDPDALRAGVRLLIGYLRDRDRFGQGPPPAHAGIDLLLNLLTIDPGSPEAEALVEVIDGLADAGLPELAAGRSGRQRRDDVLDIELLQAEIAQETARPGDRLRTELLMAGLDECPALLLRRRRTRAQPGFVAVYLRPPEGLAIKNRALPNGLVDVLTRLRSATLGGPLDVPQSDLDSLVDHMLPARLREDIEAGLVNRLVVVPDDDLWNIPWAAATPLRQVDVGLMPSIAQCTRRSRRPAEQVRSVLAVIDDNAPGADAVVDALHAARATGRLHVAHGTDLPGPERKASHDLLLFYGHGAGSGLGYRMATPAGRRSALAAARAGRFRNALIAACWSAAPPPGLALSLPTALLVGGVNTVAGGLWPLPGTETGRVVAETIDGLAGGAALRPSLRAAIDRSQVSPACHWGFAVHGVPHPVT